MEKKIAAFFDIDGTIYRDGLIEDMFKKMIKSEIIEGKRWETEVKPYFLRWDKRKGNYDHYLLKMADIYTETVKGLHESQVRFIAQKVVQQKGDRIFTYTRNQLSWHKKQNHLLIAISGSPFELVKEMCLKYAFDDCIGTKYALDKNNCFTGEYIPMWNSVGKRTALMNFVDKYNIDLSQSYAYGDTAADFSMLKSVGNPTAINPTKALLHKILHDEQVQEKVNLIIERKDVVYRLLSSSK